jgi:EAL and modified HD-GYP domain-containing signal transduction protein
MLHFLRQLLPSGNHANEPGAQKTTIPNDTGDFSSLNAQVPLQSEKDQEKSFVRREAILDRSEKVAAYEFSLLMTLQERLLRRGGMAKRTYDAALLTRLSVYKVNALLGHRLAVINVSSASLSSLLFDKLPKQNTVLMLEVSPQAGELADIPKGMAELKRKGFLCGLRIDETDSTTTPLELATPLIGDLDFIQIEVSKFNGIDLRNLSRELRSLRGQAKYPLKLIARNVQSHDDFQFCQKCGFDYFQGPFISSRESLQPMNDGINRMAILSILNLVRSDANFEKISESLKNEPTLTFKLLRYLNSPAMGLHQPVEDLKQALQLVGREKFYRWTSLLMFEFSNPSYREYTLTERALTRGRTLELLAGQGNIPQAPDHLFLAGLLSLLDVALGISLPELVAQATLPDQVRGALLGEAGAFTDALKLATLGEADVAVHQEPMAQALELCGIDDASFSLAADAALNWAHEVMHKTL